MTTRQETNRRPYDPTREQKARATLSTEPGLAVLSDASTDALVDAVIRLTHKIHTASAEYAPMPKGCTPGEVANLRDQRTLVRDELLRRAARNTTRLSSTRRDGGR